jgi:hypothetical protein
MQTTNASHSVKTLQQMTDPFNWPIPQRNDLMSLQTLKAERDLVRVKTAKVSTRPRDFSKNLDTKDIDGA